MEKTVTLDQLNRRLQAESSRFAARESADGFVMEPEAFGRCDLKLIAPRTLPFDIMNLPIPVGSPAEVEDFNLAYALEMPYGTKFGVGTGKFEYADHGPVLRLTSPKDSTHLLIMIPWAETLPPFAGLASPFAKIHQACWFQRLEPLSACPRSLGADFWVIPRSSRFEYLIHYLWRRWSEVIDAGDKFLTEYYATLPAAREKYGAELQDLIKDFGGLQLELLDDEAILRSVNDQGRELHRTHHLYAAQSVEVISGMVARMRLVDSLFDIMDFFAN